MYLNGFLRHQEDLFVQHLGGTIDERVFDSHVRHLRLALAGPWVQEHWQRTRELYSPAFCAWIDGLAPDTFTQVRLQAAHSPTEQ